MDGLGGFPAGVYGLGGPAELLRLIVAVAAVGLAIHFAAGKLWGRSSLVEGFVASFLAGFTSLLLHGVLKWKPVAVFLSMAAFALLVMLVYRAKDVKGAALGAGAYLLWLLIGWLFGVTVAS